jgi:hypothetical protein
MAGFGLAGLVSSIAVCLALPVQYEAHTVIQVGVRSIHESKTEIEKPNHLIERINSGGLSNADGAEDNLDFSLLASPVKNTQLIKLTARARSKVLAKDSLNNITSRIILEHRAISDSLDASQKVLLEYSKKEFVDNDRILRGLTSSIDPAIAVKIDPVTAVTIGQAQLQALLQRSTAAERIQRFEIALSEASTHFTKQITPVRVSHDPVYPKTIRVGFVALIVGCFFGSLVAVLRRKIRDLR